MTRRQLETTIAYYRAELAAALAVIEVLVDDRAPDEGGHTVDDHVEAERAAHALLERYTP